MTAQPQWVASDLHFSQGSEVVAWEPGDHELSVKLSLGRKALGAVTLALPSTTPDVTVAGSPVQVHVLGPNLVRIPVLCDQQVEINVRWA